MRIPFFSKLMWLGVGGVGILALMNSSRRRAPAADPMAPDPADSVQDPDMVEPLDPLDNDLDVDAMSMIDRSVDVEGTGYSASGDESLVDDMDEESVPGTGDLYGVHTPREDDRVYPDDDTAMEDGQNWIEALETRAAENGPRPEQSLDPITDDEALYAPPHAVDSDEVPVADLGSGGPAGM